MHLRHRQSSHRMHFRCFETPMVPGEVQNEKRKGKGWILAKADGRSYLLVDLGEVEESVLAQRSTLFKIWSEI